MIDKDDLKRRMKGSIDLLNKEFSGLRSGRASVNLLEPIRVDVYGSMVPIGQVATVSTPEPRLLSVQVWDKNLAKAVEKAIRESGLGLNPMAEGQVIRVPIPDLTEQRRSDLSKMAAKYAEDAKISIRNVRRDAMDYLKKMEKNKELSEDDHKKESQEVQKITDQMIDEIDRMLQSKQKDIMHV